MPKTFTVVWTMEIEAEDPRGAAVEALDIHRDPDSIAQEFMVYEFGRAHHIDLLDGD